MAFPNCSHVSATDTSRPTGADYIYCLAQEVRKLKESIAAGLDSQGELLSNVLTSVPCDPYWDNVVLAMHFDETVGATSFVDVKGHTITTLGTCAIVGSPTLFGNCLGFSGVSDKIGVNHADLVLGTGDFTLDFWVYVTSYLGDKRLGIDNTNNYWLCEIISGSGKIHLRTGGGGGGTYTTTSPSAVPLNQWTHIRISRAAGVAYTFIDGFLQTSNAYAYNLSNSNFVIINAQAGAWFVDEIELTKGIARSTTNFKIPTTPFAEVAC